MDLDRLFESSVMEDVDDLEAAFGYFRPSPQEEEDEAALAGVLPPRRLDPEVAMKRHHHQARKEAMVEMMARRKS